MTARNYSKSGNQSKIVSLILALFLFAVGVNAQCDADGGTISGGPFEFCIDGIVDTVTDITLEGNIGFIDKWLVTDTEGLILAIPNNPSEIDFDVAETGLCFIYNISYDFVMGLFEGNSIHDLSGCYDLSNPVYVVRTNNGTACDVNCNVNGGVIDTEPFEICINGIPDYLGEINITGNDGESNQWLFTDENGLITGVPFSPGTINFDQSSPGICLVWNVSYNGEMGPFTSGGNIFNTLVGCYSLSNPIVMTKVLAPQPVTLSGGPYELCIDGEADFITDITLTGNTAAFNYWVVADVDSLILGVPTMPSNFNFDEAGNGTCYVYHLTSDVELLDVVVDNNINSIQECFGISNRVTVHRIEPDGGILAGGPFVFCKDGTPDFITGLLQEGQVGITFQWVLTDGQGDILTLPSDPFSINFDVTELAQYQLYYISQLGEVVGLDFGTNIDDLAGCYDLSNAFIILRDEPDGGTLEGGPYNFCLDGIPDFATDVTLSGSTGTMNQWIVISDLGNIVGIPNNIEEFDFEVTGNSTSFIYNISFSNQLSGIELGAAAEDIVGCYALSNAIEVNNSSLLPQELEGGPYNFCVDGTPDFITDYQINGLPGNNTQWVITDDAGNILGLPTDPGTVDFDAAGTGICQVYYLSFSPGLTGLVEGGNIDDLQGCYDFSNPLTVVRNAGDGGVLAGGPFEFCVDDEPDFVSDIVLTGNEGDNSQWVIANPEGIILALPDSPEDVNFDVAGPGVCLIYNISYNEVSGLEEGGNLNTLVGCYGLSNSIQVLKIAGGSPCLENCDNVGGFLEGGPFLFCLDGEIDNISEITIEGNSAGTNQWVITDLDGLILGLPNDPTEVNFDQAGFGACLIWNISYQEGLEGLEEDGNLLTGLIGCYGVSNAIAVIRQAADGGTVNLLDGATTVNACAGNVQFEVLAITTALNFDYWLVITDADDNILAWHNTADGTLLDLSNAPAGECHVYGWSFNEAPLPVIGESIITLNDACANVSFNFITVFRQESDGGNISLADGSFFYSGFAGDIVFDVMHTTTADKLEYYYVITDAANNILDWKNSEDGQTLDLSDAPAGECHVWGWNFKDQPLPIIGENITSLIAASCSQISNNWITVERLECSALGGNIVGGPYEFCIDGVSDFITDITLNDNEGTNSQWVVTTEGGSILGLPASPELVDFNEAGEGVCLIWHLSFADGLGGAEVDLNINDLLGCFSLSNSIMVTRVTEGPLCISSLANEELAADVIISPNPATELINLQIQTSLSLHDLNYSIVDIFGQQIIANQGIPTNKISIDISDLAAGSYVLRINNGEKSTSKKFIKIK